MVHKRQYYAWDSGDLYAISACRTFSSVAQTCLTLGDSMDSSTPGLPIHHQLLKFTQTHLHWVGDAIQPSLPLSSPSPPAFNLSQHQGLFKWVVLYIWWLECWSFSFSICSSKEYSGLISFRINWFVVKWLSRVFSSTTVQKHKFFSAQPSLWSNSHIRTWLLKSHQLENVS